MIEAQGLTKTFGTAVAVDEVSFRANPGAVTGFLGPNGSGKSTTLRLILGLDSPTRGRVLVDGKPYRELVRPLHIVGALLDARDVHGGRSARGHLAMLAATHRIPRRRIGEVLDLAGLAPVADRRVRSFSLGMRQRLGMAAALLGEPRVLILDEPMNGLDTEGIRWLRILLRSMADRNCTVLLSGHVMSEMQLVADHLLVINGGRLIADEPVTEFVARHSDPIVRVRAADLAALAGLLGSEMEIRGEVGLVRGIGSREIGRLAVAYGIVLDELTPVHGSVEDAFTRLIVDHRRSSRPQVRENA
ncbi:ATP-binding cassette domain-containing protein [Nocardia sp. CDC159]|uniref:ATP-binding cassette domain-containing protein n=1 Tax=Nocardia pulmonis TaxID=2951408 RepID=A0A9X2EDF2_9NOCA|nr:MULTISPECIES: ATP-binding cassette domain-containing protein [Nocardia]MCM6778399.1 ATP-binding cassette domain-containing protein [Nocardia pulmonis]MCM6791205.1 ATP-binding cassette domain-containing protein [Nocardia sp. CDC159]